MTNTKLSKKVIITCFLAGCLEIYDFTIFGFFSDKLHSNYLSFLDKETALLASYALFAVGFVFRPLGAILFGHIGDRLGRKKALIISVSTMGLSSLGIGLLPSYNDIGVISCYILVFLRIIQGLSVGGEYSGAIIFAVEHSQKNRSGFVGSLVVSGCMSGVLLATIVSNVLKLPSMPEYSWRFAFLIGFLLSLLGFFIRKKLAETPEFINQKKAIDKVPLLQGIREAKTESLATIFIAATSGVNLYFISIFMPNHIKHLETGSQAINLASVFTCIMAILIPFFGNMSDKFGKIKLMIIGATSLCLYTFALPIIVFNVNSNNIAILAIIIHAIIASIFCGPMNTLIVEIFTVNKRYSCSAFNYSIGMGIIGGTTPMMASLISQHTGNNPLYLGGYISLISFCSLLSLLGLLYKKRKI